MQPQQTQNQPAFGYPTADNPYQTPQPKKDKKMLFLMLGGGLLVIALLLMLVFGGRQTPGQAEMQIVVKNTSESLGLLEEYQKDIASSGTSNDLALVTIILRGNLEDLSALYNKTYKPNKKISSTPKADKQSLETLDSAKRDNRLDNEIITVLRIKIDKANQALLKIKGGFTSSSSRQKIDKAQTDLSAISDILKKQ